MLDFAMIQQARIEAARSGIAVLQILLAKTAQRLEELLPQLCGLLQQSFLNMSELHAIAPTFSAVTFAQANRRLCLPYRTEDGWQVVIADPLDADLLNWLESALGRLQHIQVALASDIKARLIAEESRLRASETVSFAFAGDHEGGEQEEGLSLRTIAEDSSPTIKLINATLYDAWKVGASDIHLETHPRGMLIKYRLDGVLVETQRINNKEQAEQAISRIKVMADLDIAERRVPQDGRFKAIILGRAVDFRVSIMPSVHGEDSVIRILDKQNLSQEKGALPGSSQISLEGLGYRGETLENLRLLATEPYGMLLVTGPTGSGKTTTLYALLSEVNTGQDKIVTIEDPVEYQLPGVLQIPVNEKKGLTFARGLRSILRHDPDKILVGEIRDLETAQIAVQSALTGHLVFTTVHANNVFDVLGRFTHMGVDLYSFISALNGVVAQRLLRLNCPHCTEPQILDASLLQRSGLLSAQVQDWTPRSGRGCGVCRGTGYKGRAAISELLIIRDEFRELVVKQEPVRVLKDYAHQHGTRFLREAALDLARQGITSLQEVNRVTSINIH